MPIGNPFKNPFQYPEMKMTRISELPPNSPFPIGSMYGICTYIWWIVMVNVGKYTSPMDPTFFFFSYWGHWTLLDIVSHSSPAHVTWHEELRSWKQNGNPKKSTAHPSIPDSIQKVIKFPIIFCRWKNPFVLKKKHITHQNSQHPHKQKTKTLGFLPLCAFFPPRHSCFLNLFLAVPIGICNAVPFCDVSFSFDHVSTRGDRKGKKWRLKCRELQTTNLISSNTCNQQITLV